MKVFKIIGIVLLLFVLSIFVFSDEDKTYDKYRDNIPEKKNAELILGEPGSTHKHATILLSINGKIINFREDKYMIKDKKAHFEDGDGITIHKHATGVSLPYFFATLGIDLTDECISLDTGRQYCSSHLTGNILTIIINGIQITDISFYELEHKDKILVNYGSDNELSLKFKFNNIPDLPLEF